MKVLDVISITSDYLDIKIIDFENLGLLSYYDGKNSIDEKYNYEEIVLIDVDELEERKTLILYI